MILDMVNSPLHFHGRLQDRFRSTGALTRSTAVGAFMSGWMAPLAALQLGHGWRECEDRHLANLFYRLFPFGIASKERIAIPEKLHNKAAGRWPLCVVMMIDPSSLGSRDAALAAAVMAFITRSAAYRPVSLRWRCQAPCDGDQRVGLQRSPCCFVGLGREDHLNAGHANVFDDLDGSGSGLDSLTFVSPPPASSPAISVAIAGGGFRPGARRVETAFPLPVGQHNLGRRAGLRATALTMAASSAPSLSVRR